MPNNQLLDSPFPNPSAVISDPERLAALASLNLLDTPATPVFDRVTQLLTRVLNVPVALVSLVAADRQFFVSCIGLPEPWASTRETPLTHSFCQYPVTTRQPLVVTDARVHPSLQTNLAIPDLGVVAYAGVPLITADGAVVGAICAIDTKTRSWSDDNLALLQDMAAMVATEIELRRQVQARNVEVSRHRAAAAQLEGIIGSAMDAIIAVDHTQHITLFNPAAETMFRCKAQTLIGQPLVRLIPLFSHAEHQEPIAGSNTLLVAGQGGRTLQAVRADGETFPIKAAVTQVMVDGQAMFTVIVRDVTERVRAEIALRNSQDRLQAILDHAPAVIYVKSLEGRFQFVNRAFTATFNLDMSAVIGKTDWDLFPLSLAERFTANDQQVLTHGMPLELEEVAVDARGNRTYTSVKFPLTDAQGQVYALCGISTDITERKRFEAQMLQAQKMESVGRLAGGIAHDFNNLLMAIGGYAALLQQSLQPTGESQADLAEIQNAVERASALTQQLLAFSRKQTVAPRVFNLNDCVRDLDKLVRRLIGADIELVTLLAPDLQPIKADYGQMEQVLVNLVVNARDAMPHGGKLTITTSNTQPTPTRVRVTVRDTGVGIPPEVQTQVFEPFFTTKAVGQGTGLGLATCFNIVTEHRGTIAITSKVGMGTTVTVELPASDSAAVLPDDRLVETNMRLRGTETVLVAEDEASVRVLIVRALKQYGYHVLEAATGEDAVRIAEAYGKPIDVLVTDLVMPRLGGRQLAQLLRQTRPTMTILFISGYSGDTSAPDYWQWDGRLLLRKPFTPIDLITRIRDLLDHPSDALNTAWA